MEMPFEFFVHDALSIERSLSIKVIGSLNENEILLIKSIPHYEDPFGFESEISTIDEKMSLKYDFNIDDLINPEKDGENDCVLFDFAFGIHKENIFKQFVYEKYPSLKEYPSNMSQIYCSSFFANVHHDKDVITSRGQLMFVLENKIGHRLLSIDENGKEHIVVPTEGDIIFLDISLPHAVFPNQKDGVMSMRENRLVFAGVSYNN